MLHYQWWECVRTVFPHLFALDYIKIWLRSRSRTSDMRSRTSDMQIRTASQKSSETGRSSVEILLGECSLYLVQSSFSFGVGMAFLVHITINTGALYLLLSLVLHKCIIHINDVP